MTAGADPIRVIVVVAGGVVQEVRANRDDIQLSVLDYDELAAIEDDADQQQYRQQRDCLKQMTQECPRLPHVIF